MQDKEKTTFGTPKSNFEFNVMPFGLTNATAMVQSVMECVLGGLGGERVPDISGQHCCIQQILERAY